MNSFTVRNCNVPCCNGQHFIKFINGKAVIPIWEFFKIVRHWTKNVKNICGPMCPTDISCKPHRLLNVLRFFSEHLHL